MIDMGILFNEVENSFQEKSVDPIMYYEYCGFKWYISLCINLDKYKRNQTKNVYTEFCTAIYDLLQFSL